jgi:hypothetical protein
MIPVRSIVAISSRLANDPARLQFGALQPAQLSRDLQSVGEALLVLTAWKREMLTIQKQHAKAQAWKGLTTGERPFVDSSPSV